jgi:hypothetical protein
VKTRKEPIPAIDIEVDEPSAEETARGKFHSPDNDGEARAQLARDADAAWGHGDGAGLTWEAPNPDQDAWIPTINTWALHQSDEVAAWLQRKREDDARDLALMPARMQAAIDKAPEHREKLRHVQNHYAASLQRQLAHIDKLRAMTGDTTPIQSQGHPAMIEDEEDPPSNVHPIRMRQDARTAATQTAAANAVQLDAAGRMCVKSAAQYLGRAERTLWNWRQQGIGPKYYLLGPRSVRYSIQDLDDYLEICRRDPLAMNDF